eukprot:47863_1
MRVFSRFSAASMAGAFHPVAFNSFRCSGTSIDEMMLLLRIQSVFKHKTSRTDVDNIMSQIRLIDPYTTSNELSMKCSDFILRYHDIPHQQLIDSCNRWQFVSLLLQNVIEKTDNNPDTHPSDQTKEALLSK